MSYDKPQGKSKKGERINVLGNALIYSVGKKGYPIITKVISIFDKNSQESITIPTFAFKDIIDLFEKDKNGDFNEFTQFEQDFI